MKNEDERTENRIYNDSLFSRPFKDLIVTIKMSRLIKKRMGAVR